ncbi:hypothetical protein ACFQFQ_27615 [Sulfitobacter porphyrae]|uniref:Thiamine pyrophosphate enzyme central domain-containing protein n=1 Tax=Sulfitobacter porphyrae TaxID=1246864 RepID=A0ABW2B9P4_9RHOB
MDEIARLIAGAKNPVIFAQHGAGSAEAFDALARLAEQWSIPVCQYWAVELAMSMTHPMATGPDPRPWLENADVVLCLDALAPWSPAEVEPQEDATVIQIGPRPLQDRSGVRNFRCDIGISSEVAPAILALEAALSRLEGSEAAEKRGKDIAQRNAADRAARFDAALAGENAASLTKRWVSHELSLHLRERDAAVFSELGCQLPSMKLERHQSWFDGPHAGGLGWGSRRPWALPLPDLTRRWWPPWVTGPTCLPTLSPATRSPKRWGSRCWSSC